MLNSIIVGPSIVDSMMLSKIKRYAKEQCIFIVYIFYQNSENFTTTVRKLRSTWGIHNGPNKVTVRRLIKKFSESKSVINVKQ